MANKHCNSGFTLVELIVAMAVVSTTLGIAVPSFQSMTDRYRIKGAAEALFYSFHTARTQAIKSNTAVTVAFQTGSNWSANLSDSATCAIDSATCVGGDWTSNTLNDEYRGTEISATTFAANNTNFDPKRGTATNGAVTLTLNDYAIQVQLNVLGNPKYCADNAATVSAFGYLAC